MKDCFRWVVAVCAAMTTGTFTMAGELIERTVAMRMDISGKFTRDTPGRWYPAWRARVMKQFRRFSSGELNGIYTFVRTDIPISADGKIRRGAAYQCMEKPDAFFLPAEFTRIHFKKREVTDTWRDQLAVSPDRSVIVIERFGGTLPYAKYKFEGKAVEWMGKGESVWPGWLRDKVVK